MKPVTSLHQTELPAVKVLPAGITIPKPRTVLAVIGGVLLLGMMGITVVDVVGRYLFNAPLAGASELTEMLLAATIFLGLPAVSLDNEHVTVDLVTDQMPRWVHPWRLAITGVAGAGVLLVVAWRIWVYAAQFASYGGASQTLGLPIAPLGYFCAICTVAGALLTAWVPLRRLVLWLKAEK